MRLGSIYFLFLLFSIKSGAQTFYSLPTKANKMKYDKKRSKIYATVSSADANYGNMLIQLDPHTGTVENSVFVGSEPTCLALTNDTNFVYIGLDGASFVKRVNISTFQVDRSISLGNGSSGSMFAEDVACINSTPDVVVVSRKYIMVSPRHAGVAAYKNIVKLTNETPGHTGSNIIEGMVGTDTICGFNTESSENGFRIMRIDTTNGVFLVNTTPNMPFSLDMESNGDLVYSNFGKVVDPSGGTPLVTGTFSLTGSWNWTSVEVVDASNKTYFCTTNYSQLQLSYFNTQTFAFINDTLISGLYPSSFQSPQVFDMESYNSNGLAVIVGETYPNPNDKRLILFKPLSDVGIHENALEDKVNIYPVPARNELFFELGSIGKVKFDLRDLTGRLLVEGEMLNENTINSVDVSDLLPGVYIIKLEDQNSFAFKKVIITK